MVLKSPGILPPRLKRKHDESRLCSKGNSTCLLRALVSRKLRPITSQYCPKHVLGGPRCKNEQIRPIEINSEASENGALWKDQHRMEMNEKAGSRTGGPASSSLARGKQIGGGLLQVLPGQMYPNSLKVHPLSGAIT